jgi:hypothetical protein
VGYVCQPFTHSIHRETELEVSGIRKPVAVVEKAEQQLGGSEGQGDACQERSGPEPPGLPTVRQEMAAAGGQGQQQPVGPRQAEEAKQNRWE